MLTKIAVFSGLLVAAPFLHAAGSANPRFYLTPSAEYMFVGNLKLGSGAAYPYRDIEFKDTAGWSLEGGFLLSPKHILKFETGYFKTETENPGYLVTTSLYGLTTAELEIVPFLVGYKYSREIDNRWRLQLGVSSGATLLHSRRILRFLGQFGLPPRDLVDTDTNYAFTAGAEAAADYSLSERSTLTLGVKCRAMDSTSVTTRAVTTSLNLGYKFRF